MSGIRCEGCGACVSTTATHATCPTCWAARADAVRAEHTARATPRRAPAAWMWSTPDASAALGSRDLSTILRSYRRLNRMSQAQLAAVLDYDQTYISMLETRRRVVNDIAGRRHIAETLGLPAHVLGVTDRGDADFAAMIQFADSTIRLAELARRAGRAVNAVNELWPLVARLEARATEGHVDRDTLVLLGQARVALGVSLGTVLPEERLSAAARWTGKALVIAEHLDDPSLLAHTLRMHGNELRKANHVPAAVVRLRRAAALSADADGRATALAFLARAAGEHGDRATFDDAITRYRDLLESAPGNSMLANPFTFREIQLRGLAATGRVTDAIAIMRAEDVPATPVAPQWHVIERVTTGQIHHAVGDHDSAAAALRAALTAAETHELPHQIQRTIRVARTAGLLELAADATSALTRVDALLSAPCR